MKANERAPGEPRFYAGVLNDGRYIKTDTETGTWEEIPEGEWKRLAGTDNPARPKSSTRLIESAATVATAIVGLGIIAALTSKSASSPPSKSESPSSPTWAPSSPRTKASESTSSPSTSSPSLQAPNGKKNKSDAALYGHRREEIPWDRLTDEDFDNNPLFAMRQPGNKHHARPPRRLITIREAILEAWQERSSNV